MKTNLLIGLSSLLLLTTISLSGCSESNEPHPQGWNASNSHGSAAKAAEPGLGSCTPCHGSDFNGGAGQSCKTCHNSTAPHPAAPWRGTTATGTTHTTTDQSNAAVCARCHLNNQRLTVPQNVPVGTTPGCFNNTLCHGAASGHPTGWSAASSHGTAAKAVPSATQGLNSCTQCHGTNFVSSSATSCLTCHTTAPHPATPWRGTTASGTTHTTTDGGNAAECARCHLNNQRLTVPQNVPAGTTPGCFNNTLCHGAASGHPAGWSDPANHGPAAKAVNGLNSCTVCHTATFAYNCTNLCHTPPHPGAWDVKAVYTHQSTDQSNAGECSKCHRTTGTGTSGIYMATGYPLATPLAGAGCFASNLCHGQVGGTGPAHPVHMALPTPANNCTTCHTVTPGALNFNPQYNAKSGAASFNSTTNTCTNVSCHGGQTTPVWAAGTLAVPGNGNSDCKKCHSGSTTQYNSYISGEHNRHVVSESIACTACHDTTRLASTHFTSLNTPALNNPPATIKASLNYSGGRCGSPGCHGSQNW